MQYIIPYCNPKNYSFMLIKHKFVNQPYSAVALENVESDLKAKEVL